MYTEIIAVAVVLFYALGIVSAVEAIINVRTAQGAIAWAISLLAVPYIAVPCYLVFGRTKFDGYLEQRNAVEQETRELLQQTRAEVSKHLVFSSPAEPVYNALFNLTGLSSCWLMASRPSTVFSAVWNPPNTTSCSSLTLFATTTWAGASAGSCRTRRAPVSAYTCSTMK